MTDQRKSIQREPTRAKEAPESTWWDRRDTPPQAVTDILGKVGRSASKIIPPSDSAESQVGRTVRIAVLAATFLFVMWLLLTAVIEQS